jgi:hypothetical protein
MPKRGSEYEPWFEFQLRNGVQKPELLLYSSLTDEAKAVLISSPLAFCPVNYSMRDIARDAGDGSKW